MNWQHLFTKSIKCFRSPLLGVIKATKQSSVVWKVGAILVRKMSGKKDLDLSGIYPPISTPFNEKEDVNYDKLRFNLKKWNDIPFAGKSCRRRKGQTKSIF